MTSVDWGSDEPMVPLPIRPRGSAVPKITKRLVDATEPRPAEYFVWDTDIPGFGLRVLPTGRKSYVVQYRVGRRSRRISLGPCSVLSCDQARNRAIAAVASAKNGEDPAAQRDADRKAITVRQLAARFDDEHIAVRLKTTTAKEYRRNLQRFILPALGHLTVAATTRADVAKFHHDLRHIPYQANRCIEVVSKMFNLAEMWGLRPDGTNPRKHLRKYPEEKRQRFLSAAELRRLGEVLREMEAEGVELPSAILAVRLLTFTGCRLNEIMTLKWEHVDLATRVLRLPDSKTGAKVVHLGEPAVELLRLAVPTSGTLWVVPGTIDGQRLSDLQPFWQRVRARAGLKDVRIHDLRHTFASAALASGEGLPMIGKLLGHTQVQTTARYAHLADEPVRSAADVVSIRLHQSLG
jgi:integrase